jgi:hypothetical protein
VAKKQMVCLRCHETDFPLRKTSGSIIIELALWLFFIIPGIIYSIWRGNSTKLVCRSCESDDLVPLNTVKGREILEAAEKLRPVELVEKSVFD